MSTETVQRTVVVGAGFGGIAAAVRARALGHSVTLVDRLDQLGGRARVVSHDGVRFDAGPTVITAPFLLAELWSLLGERMEDHVELLAVSPFYRIRFSDGRHFDYSGDTEAMLAEVARFSPGDVAGYRQLLARSGALYRVGYEQYGAASFHRPATMLQALPRLLALGGARSVYANVRRHIADDSLRRVFSFQPLLVGGHPFQTSGIYALIQHLERAHGVWFPRGGTGAVVTALGDLMRRHGVEIRLGTDVTRITADRARRLVTGIMTGQGEYIAADTVIANADAPAIYADLLDDVPRRRRWSPRRVDRLVYSMGLFVLYFVTDRRYPATAHHTILLGETYKALLDEVFGTKAVLPEDLSLYLHRPSATDPAMAPAGKDAFYVLAPVPNLLAPIDWAREGPRVRDRIVEILQARELEGLSRAIVSESFMTPATFAADYRSRHGAGFSIAPRLTQSAWFRFHNRSEEVAGLYLVGAGTHPGAGLPGVLTSAKVVEQLLRRPAA